MRQMLNMREALTRVSFLFHAIASTPKTTEKKRLLHYINSSEPENVCEMFLYTLRFLLDNNVTTGIDKKKLKTQINMPDINFPMKWSHMLEYIKENNTGRHEDIRRAQLFIEDNPENAEFIADIITKSYRLGLTAKTVNEVYEDFIPVWSVQQAYPLEKYPLKDGEWFSLSQKLNGFHASYYRGKLISRQGKEIKGCQHIINAINNFKLQDFFIDGELIRRNDIEPHLSDEENFRQTVSIANSDSDDKTDLCFIYYDIIPADDFDKGKCEITYHQRLNDMHKLNSIILQTPFYKTFHMVKWFYHGNDQNKIQFWLDYANENDMEGLMLNKDATYQCKRNSGVLKVKSWKHCDLRVTGVEEGDGKYKGTLGKLIVNYKGNPLGLSGMSDEERYIFWNNPQDIVGKIVLVKYKQETKDKTGKRSLQFATYQGVRTDKDEVSYN